MTTDFWTTLTLLVTWVGHITTAAAIGGLFALAVFFRHSRATKPVARYVLISCGLGIAVITAKFFVQVGSFADQGLTGMADPLYMSLLWQTDIRVAILEKIAGFILVALATVVLLRYSRKNPAASPLEFVAGAIAVAGISLLALAHQQIGHTADGSALARTAVVLHVVAMGLWIGCLYPLWRACSLCEASELHRVMSRFGNLAAGIVAVLVILGIALLILLVGSVENLLTTTYGQGLLIKLLLVGALLAIAAGNKWLWVPRLERQSASARHLSRAICLEMVVALIILLVTAYITTFTGAPH